MASQYSPDGKYFAQLSTDGKLKIWESATSTFLQEFTPDYHLTSPCTCLHFVELDPFISKVGSPRKKVKRRNSYTGTDPYIALGTSSGTLLVYSIVKANVHFNISSDLNQSVTCLSWKNFSPLLAAGVEQYIIFWDLEKRSIKSKWKAGNDRISAVLNLPSQNMLLTASKNIKLWNSESKELIRTFTGHSSEITILEIIGYNDNSNSYFISGSKGDRFLSCWNINADVSDNNAVLSCLMEDTVVNVSSSVSENGSINLAAVIRSGIVQLYRLILNGKCTKPLKPCKMIQIASDAKQNQSVIVPIPIFGTIFTDDKTLLLCHGSSLLFTFESIILNEYQKVQILVRKDPRTVCTTRESHVSKIRSPIIDDEVHYLTPQTSKLTNKRKTNAEEKFEIPMEKRLENLMIHKVNGSSDVPKVDNVANLLIQGLHSKDTKILKTVLSKKEDPVIRNTIKRLPIKVIVPFVKELSKFIEGKTLSCQIGVLWLKHLLQIHAAVLLSNPEIAELLSGLLATIESRLNMQRHLCRLKGRLDLLVSQINVSTTGKDSEEQMPLIEFNDKDTSDSETTNFEMPMAQSDSENEWMEENDEDEVDEDMDDSGNEVSK